MLETPILFIIFNRPDTSEQVFNQIRQIQPKQIFIAADGPRVDIPTDVAQCALTRKIISRVDWNCNVHTLVRDHNMGCGYGIADAITWFFKNVEEGIILEDDCVPNLTFFRFCEELLCFYRNEPRIMHISGNNFLYGKKRGNASYYFSKYTHNWGWATWRRAWVKYDHNIVDEEYRHSIWDMQWRLTVENNNGLAILPNVNLVSNIGTGRKDATHTKGMSQYYSNLPTEILSFPLQHPKKIKIMDRATDYSVLVPHATSYIGILKEKLKSLVNRIWTSILRCKPLRAIWQKIKRIIR
jgi:hypothetical protein